MMIPTVHMNGTGKDALLLELEEAIQSIVETISKVKGMTIHGRDYYIQTHGAIGEAIREHCSRLLHLETVKHDLEEMYYGIEKQ